MLVHENELNVSPNLAAVLEQMSASLARLERSVGSLKSQSQRLASSTKTGGSDSWRTPTHVIEAVTRAYGDIALDPCAAPDTAKQFAVSNLVERDDEPSGLTVRWAGLTYVNPPFSQMTQWAAKVCVEAERGVPMVVLAKNSRARWFRAMRAQCAGIVEAPTRLRFNDGSEPAMFDVVFFVFNLNPEALFEALGCKDRHGLFLHNAVAA